jgi:hypothetical protein
MVSFTVALGMPTVRDVLLRLWPSETERMMLWIVVLGRREAKRGVPLVAANLFPQVRQ